MKLSHQYFTYIVHCSDDCYYVGITNDLDRRLSEHNEGINPRCFTFKRRPVMLHYYETFMDVLQAIACEKQWKGWSRAKKEALIAGNQDKLKALSQSRNRNEPGC